MLLLVISQPAVLQVLGMLLYPAVAFTCSSAEMIVLY